MWLEAPRSRDRDSVGTGEFAEKMFIIELNSKVVQRFAAQLLGPTCRSCLETNHGNLIVLTSDDREGADVFGGNPNASVPPAQGTEPGRY